MIKGDENTNKEELEETLDEIQISMARMSTNIKWMDRIIVVEAVLIAGLLGIQLPAIFIHG